MPAAKVAIWESEILPSPLSVNSGLRFTFESCRIRENGSNSILPVRRWTQSQRGHPQRRQLLPAVTCLAPLQPTPVPHLRLIFNSSSSTSHFCLSAFFDFSHLFSDPVSPSRAKLDISSFGTARRRALIRRLLVSSRLTYIPGSPWTTGSVLASFIKQWTSSIRSLTQPSQFFTVATRSTLLQSPFTVPGGFSRALPAAALIACVSAALAAMDTCMTCSRTGET